ncbi:MAG: hypothetical protein IPJ58_16760 [Ardenticatenia bacterium]|nr:hypothetical protein [Ardenticatenia bacterium]
MATPSVTCRRAARPVSAGRSHSRLMVFAGGAQDGVVHVWQVSDGSTVRALSGHPAAFRLRFSADGGLLLSASADHTIRAWDTSDGTALHVIEAHAGAVTAMTLSNDGRWLLSGSQDGHVRLWGLGLR